MPARSQPLAGWRVAITRPTASGHGLARRLVRQGAEPFIAPLLRVVPPADPRPLAALMADLARYDWLVFPSANAVRSVGPLLARRTWRPRAAAPRVAAVGPATAQALESHGVPVDFIPARFDGETLAEGLELAPGQRVLLPRSAIATAALPQALRNRGALVDLVTAYTLAPGTGAARLEAALAAGAIDCLTLFSPSAARALRGLSIGPPGALPPVVAVGPVTAAAAAAVGIPIAACATRFDDEGVADQIIELAAPWPAGAWSS